MEHLDDNAQASQTQLSEKDMAMIGEVLAQAGE
jgi:aryl-alcohol dehydrogenase-like predicted oxidoreductase